MEDETVVYKSREDRLKAHTDRIRREEIEDKMMKEVLDDPVETEEKIARLDARKNEIKLHKLADESDDFKEEYTKAEQIVKDIISVTNEGTVALNHKISKKWKDQSAKEKEIAELEKIIADAKVKLIGLRKGSVDISKEEEIIESSKRRVNDLRIRLEQTLTRMEEICKPHEINIRYMIERFKSLKIGSFSSMIKSLDTSGVTWPAKWFSDKPQVWQKWKERFTRMGCTIVTDRSTCDKTVIIDGAEAKIQLRKCAINWEPVEADILT